MASNTSVIITLHTRGSLIETHLQQASIRAFPRLPDVAIFKRGPRNYEIVKRVSENQFAFEGNDADLWEERYQRNALVSRSYYSFPHPRQRFPSRQEAEVELTRRATMTLPVLKEQVNWQSPWGAIEVVTTFFDPIHHLVPEAYHVETATGSGFLFEDGIADSLLSEQAQALAFSWNGFACFHGEKALLMIAYEHPEWSTDDDPMSNDTMNRLKEALQRLAPDDLASLEELPEKGKKNERNHIMMTHLLVLAEHTYAGYCSTGAKKDWAACLVIETNDQNANPPAIEETTEVVYLSIHGPHGGNMVVDPPKKLPMKQALRHFAKKCREKEHKAYQPVPFASYLPALGRPFGLPLIAAEKGEQTKEPDVPVARTTQDETALMLNYHAVIVKAVPQEKIQRLLQSGHYGISEKVNSERCLLVSDGEQLAAYNRRGMRMSTVPTGAIHLCRLGCPFVIDGERLTGNLAGHFVAFDLLEWKREIFTSFSYITRIMTLQEALFQAGLLVSLHATPTFDDARANSTVSDLSLLVSVAGAQIAPGVVVDIEASYGEGIVVRRLEADYAECPLKWKFVADLDAFVIGINDSDIAEGSLKFGIIRSEDAMVIEVANVRAGFTDDDIRTIRTMLAQGERPVFTITYLPIRTIGIQLVEPRSGMDRLRTDKSASECTTEQFDAAKAPIIARAKPVAGRTLL